MLGGCRKPAQAPPGATRPAGGDCCGHPAMPPITTGQGGADHGNAASRPASQAGFMSRSAGLALEAIGKRPVDLGLWRQVSKRLTQATQAMEHSANDAASLLAAGDRLLARGDYLAARKCFERAAELAPGDLDAMTGMAVVLSLLESDKEAAALYGKIADAARYSSPPGRPADELAKIALAARFNQALAMSKAGDLKQAEAVYMDVLKQAGGHVEALYNLANVYQASGKLAQAVQTWQAVLTRKEQLSGADVVSAWNGLAEAQLELGDAKGAMESLAAVTKQRPADPQAWLNYASAAREAGSYGIAMAAVQNAAGLAKDDFDVHARLAGLRLEVYRGTQDRKFLVLALEAMDRSLELNPSQPDLEKLRRQYRQVLQVATAPK